MACCLRHGNNPIYYHQHQLSTLGEDKEWLKDPNIFGNYNVAYVSAGSSQRGNPAGGRWRGRVGRCLFRSVQQRLLLEKWPSFLVSKYLFRTCCSFDQVNDMFVVRTTFADSFTGWRAPVGM